MSEPMAAHFWVRAGAMALDGIVLSGFGMAVAFLIGRGFDPRSVPTALSYAITILYAALMVGFMDRSFGKRLAGVLVVRAEDGQPLGHRRAWIRAVVSQASVLLLGFGYLVALFTKRRQTLHDLAARSVVVYDGPMNPVRCGLMAGVGVVAFLIPVAVAAYIPFAASGISKVAMEAGNKGHLGTLRSGLSIYYGDTEGAWPKSLEDLAAAKDKAGQSYLGGPIPELKLPDHPPTTEVQAYGAEICPGGPIDPGRLRDSGRWAYVSAPKAPCDGAVFIDCTHQDSKGKAWHSF